MTDERITAHGRVVAARLAAVLADVTQIVLFPLFAGGAASPWNDALDVGVAAALTALIGWHWAFLPSFLAELVPGLDLVPTWTAAVFLATRGRASSPAPAGKARDFVEAEIVSSEALSPASGKSILTHSRRGSRPGQATGRGAASPGL